MNREYKSKSVARMNRWLYLHTIIIILAAITSSLFVELMSALFFGGNLIQGIGKTMGTFLPICILLGAYNMFMFRSASRHIDLLTKGIAKIADGDFAVRIDTKGAKSLIDVYENINKMASELQNMQMMRNDFINNFSHEIKTPINCIHGFAELLKKGGLTHEDREKYIDIIYEESARLSALASNTILLTKLDNQQIIDNKQSYPLGEQLRQCVILFSNEWIKKDLTIDVDIDDVTYFSNKELLNHLFINLIGNAIKFTDTGGKICISLHLVEKDIVITVADNGIGMTAEQQAKIFDKFYQSDGERSSQGLGLGLAIANRIASLCGGKIEVKSQPSMGSEFKVILPSKRD